MKKIKIEIPELLFGTEPFEVVLCYDRNSWLVFDERGGGCLPLKEHLIHTLVFFDVSYPTFCAILQNTLEKPGENQDVFEKFPFEEIIPYGLSTGYKWPGGGGESYSWLSLDWIGSNCFPITQKIEEELRRLKVLCQNERLDIASKVNTIQLKSTLE